jgi:hypothetical protein
MGFGPGDDDSSSGESKQQKMGEENSQIWVNLGPGLDVLVEPSAYAYNRQYPAFEIAEILRRYARMVRNGPGTRVKHTSQMLESIASDFEEGKLIT